MILVIRWYFIAITHVAAKKKGALTEFNLCINGSSFISKVEYPFPLSTQLSLVIGKLF